LPDLVIIRRPRMVIALTEQQVLDLLKQHPDTWADALKRGKHIVREEKALCRRVSL
jgi:hypothetical protein